MQQGSAADVAMLAMLEISKNKQLKELGWKLLLQVNICAKNFLVYNLYPHSLSSFIQPQYFHPLEFQFQY